MDARTEKHARANSGKEIQSKTKKSIDKDDGRTDESLAKKPKRDFEIDRFSEQLKLDGNAAIEALGVFIECCHRYEEDSDCQDPVSIYLQVSTQCTEMLNLLDMEKRPLSEVAKIFEAITQIILRITTDLAHHASTAVHIVNRVLRAHMRHIVRALNCSNTAKIIMSSLKLMTAMVAHSVATAREVLALYNIGHEGLVLLLNRTDKKAVEDVRICVLRFIMAFLITDDNQIVEQLLTYRELMKSIFKEIGRDRMSTLHLILPTMQRYIVMKASITKTQKLKLFNDYTLSLIARLYKWQGMDDIQNGDDSLATVRRLVHGFLLEVTCNLKHGINFYDKTLGTISGSASNSALLKFALNQRSVNEDSLVQELIVKILQTCPDILSAYLAKSSLSFAPRVSRVWQANMAFVTKVYSSLDIDAIVANLHDNHSVSKMVSMAMVATAPVVLTQTAIVQGLKIQQGALAIGYTLLDFVQLILNQSQKVTQAFQRRWPDKSEFMTAFPGAVQKALPDVNAVLPVFQRVLLKWKEGLSSSALAKSNESKEAAMIDVPTPSAVLLLGKYLQILSMYQQVLPSCFEQTSQDFSLVVHSVFGRGKSAGDHGNEVDDGDAEDLVALQCHCVSFLMGFPAGRFRWFKEVKGEGTAMYKLLTVLTSTSHQTLKQHLNLLINKLLLETGLFEHTPAEVSFWLDNLMTLDPGDRKDVVSFLQGCLTTAIRNPYPYNDRVADCVASGQASRQQHLHGDKADGKSFDIEDIPDIIDLAVDPSVQLDEHEAPSQSDDLKVLWPDPVLPCSALLPAALEKLTQTQATPKKLVDKKEATSNTDSIADYLTNVATTILHQQVDPLPLCLLLQQYGQHEVSGKPASDSWQKMVQYSGYWLDKKNPKKMSSSSVSKKLLKDLKSLTTFSASLQACFESKSHGLLHDEVWAHLNVKIRELSVAQITTACRHVLLYLHTVLDMQSQINEDTILALVDKHMALIQNIINHARQLHSKTTNQKHLDSTESSHLKTEVVNWDQLASIILKHPVFLYWYQWNETEDTGGLAVKEPEQARAVSAAVIGYTLRFLAQFCRYVSSKCRCDVSTPYARKTFFDLKTAVNTYFTSVVDQENETADIEMDKSEENSDSDFTDSDNGETKSELNLERLNDSGDGLKDSSVCLDEFSTGLQIFIILSLYVNDSVLSHVIHSTLKQQEGLLEEKDSNEDTDKSTPTLTPLGQIICALSATVKDSTSSLQIGSMLCGLLHTTGCEEFGNALLSLMKKHDSHHALTGTEEMLLDFLNHPTPVRTKVASQLIKQSFAHRCQFESWCLEVEGQRSLRKNKKMLLPILSVYWESRRTSETKEVSGGTSTLSILWDVYWPWLSNWLVEDQTNSDITSETLTQMTQAFTSVVAMSKTTPALVVSLLQRLLEGCLETDQVLNDAQIGLLFSLTKMADQHVHTLVLLIQLQQMTALSADAERAPSMETLISNCHESLKKTTQKVSLSLCPELPLIWKQFIKQTLKNDYNRAPLHNLLASLVPMLYGDPDLVDKLVSLERLYQMIVSHSRFLPIMLAESDGKDAEKDAEAEMLKGGLVRLMLAIASLEPACCQTGHFAILLGAYSASQRESDQSLLTLMSVYEENKAVMWQYRPYMWGPVVITQHAARKALGHDLWQQPTMREVLELLDPARLHQSALKFPLHRKLHRTSSDVALQMSDECYDPCFLLPLFSHLLAPESVADCKKFAECHGMEFVLAALGSYDPAMRTAAYHILMEYHQHIMGAKMMGKRELMYLMECLRNSLTKSNCRLPNVVALFIGRTTTTMLSPSQHIYPMLVQFLTIKPQIQLTSVPMFHRLFYSTNLKHRQEREWMMQLLLDGLRDAEDFQVYEKTGIFKTLLAFQLAVLCGDTLNTQIFELLGKACVIPEAAHQLIRQHSVLTWIDAHINKDSNIASLEQTITLLHIICKSVLTSSDPSNNQVSAGKDQQEVELNSKVGVDVQEQSPDASTRPGGGKDTVGRSRGRYSLPVGSTELLFGICVRTLDHLKLISAGVKPSCLQQYLETLSAIFQHRTVSSTKKTPATVQQVDLPLRSRHVANLLQLYASVLKKTDLMEELAWVSSAGLDESGDKVASRKHGQKDVEEDLNALHDEENVEGICTKALLDVITHWKPLLVNSGGHMHEQTIEYTTGGEKHEQTIHLGDNTDNVFVLVVIKWVLSSVSSVDGMTAEHWRSALTFVRRTVEGNSDIQHCLIGNPALTVSGPVAEDVTTLLLQFYSRDRYPFTKSDECFDEVENDINHIFLQLVLRMGDRDDDEMAEAGELGSSPRVRAAFAEPLEKCKQLLSGDAMIDNTVASQLTALLMRELWIGSEAPHHFIAAWKHCIRAAKSQRGMKDGAKSQKRIEDGAKGQKDVKGKKRKSLDGGDNLTKHRTPKKKKHIKTK